jgi:hypothetical protein
MTRQMSHMRVPPLYEIAARALPEPERDALLGDLHEQGVSGAAALRDVLGLVCRRHAGYWRVWQPWAAGFGVALPSVLLAMGASLALVRDVMTALDPTDSFAMSFALVALRVVLLTVWAWSCGACIGMLSRRTRVISGAFTLLPCLYCVARYHDAVLPFISLFVLLPFLLWGVKHTTTGRTRRPSLDIARAAAISGGALLLGGVTAWWTWPAWYLVLGTHTTPPRSASPCHTQTH